MSAKVPGVTKDQALMLADLACAVRPHGARQWDAPSVVSVLASVRHLDLADLIVLTVRAAADRENEVPATILRAVEEARA